MRNHYFTERDGGTGRRKYPPVEEYFGAKEGRRFLVSFSEFVMHLWKVPHLHGYPKIQQATRDLLGLTEEVCSREGTWTRSPDPQTSLIITSSSFFPFHCRGGHQELRHYTTLTFCVFEEELWSLQSDICYPRQLIALGCPLASSGQRLEKLLCTRQSETRRRGLEWESISSQKKENKIWGKREEKKTGDRCEPKRKKQLLVSWHGFQKPFCED